MGDTDAYHGPHPAPIQEGYERLDWTPYVPRTDRVRVRSHTCECRNTIYELCAAGGMMFIRRSYRNAGVSITQSPWLRAAKADALWLRLLLGQIR